MRFLKHALGALVVIACLSWAGRAHAGLTVYHLYVIWLQGEGEGDQKNLDAFIDCLFHHSSYETYWNGQTLVVEEGSYVVPKPAGVLGDAGQIGPFIDGLINSKQIPAPLSFGTNIYEVMVDPYQTSTNGHLGSGTGGRNAVGTVQGKTAGLIINTTNPQAFWPARDPLGCETQLTEHEVAEVIDGLRGGYQCCGDFCCEGWCNNAASCGNFAGLSCPGAPASTKTGSSACGSVTGWLVQTLTHAGATTCSGSPTCDFKLGGSCTSDLADLHAPCSADSDCCSGTVCRKWTYSGRADDPPADVCCKAAGASCTSGTDCCGGMDCDANTHTCTCVAAGQFCANDGDCCDGLSCQSGLCATKPPPVVDAGPDASDAGAKPPEAGADGDVDGGTDASSAEGCSCRAGAASPRSTSAIAALLALALVRRRRRV